MEAGHPDAWDYTIGRIVDEAVLVETRAAARLTELTHMMHLAIAAVPNMGLSEDSCKAAQERLAQIAKEHLGQ